MPRVAPSSAVPETADQLWGMVNAVADHRPAANAAMKGWISALMSEGTLPSRLLELVRLRIAFHNQCRSCMAVRYEPGEVGEDLVCSLEAPAEAPDLTEAEKTALRFADLFATNHLAIGDAHYDDLRVHFTEAELVELGMFCAYCVGTGRLVASWNIVEPLPDSFRHTTGPVSPWGHQEVRTPVLPKKPG